MSNLLNRLLCKLINHDWEYVKPDPNEEPYYWMKIKCIRCGKISYTGDEFTELNSFYRI